MPALLWSTLLLLSSTPQQVNLLVSSVGKPVNCASLNFKKDCYIAWCGELILPYLAFLGFLMKIIYFFGCSDEDRQNLQDYSLPQ